MVTLEDVGELARSFDGVREQGGEHPRWRTSRAMFVWSRPLGRRDVADLEAAGRPVPEGEVVAVRVADTGVRDALIADDPRAYLTIPHFGDWPAVLVDLEHVDADELAELVTDSWLLMAPPTRARAFLAQAASSSDNAAVSASE